MRLIFLTCTIFLLASAAHADVYYDGARAALNEHDGIINDFTQLNMNQRVQNALNNLIMSAAGTLEQKGYADDAQTMRREWNQNYASALTSEFTTMDLGDHSPLNVWLGKTYKNLQDKLGDPVMRALHLDDINVINYGIPVVIQPRGDRRNGDHWNKAEYKLHFVPLISVVTYWSSLIACNVATGALPAVHRWCSLIAMICRNGMHNMFAPKLSDFVYAKFGGKQSEMTVDYAAIDSYYESQFASVPRE